MIFCHVYITKLRCNSAILGTTLTVLQLRASHIHSFICPQMEAVVKTVHGKEDILVGHNFFFKWIATDLPKRVPKAHKFVVITDTTLYKIYGSALNEAFDTAKLGEGRIVPGHGYTRLHITPGYNLGSVDGLLTGLHEPHASHLDLLQAFLSKETIFHAYQEAIDRGYLWHEFGDLNLII